MYLLAQAAVTEYHMLGGLRTAGLCLLFITQVPVWPVGGEDLPDYLSSQTSRHQFPVTGLHLHKPYWDSGFNTWNLGYIEAYRPPHKLQLKVFLLRENPVFRGLWRRWPFTRQTDRPELDSICIPEDERPWRAAVSFQPPQRAAEKSFFNHLIVAVLSSASHPWFVSVHLIRA